MRVTSLVAFTIVVAVDGLYIGLINGQGPSAQPYIPRFVGAYLAVMAALIVIALLPRPEIAMIRAPLRAAAAAGLLMLGIFAAFSIGLPLVVAGILAPSFMRHEIVPVCHTPTTSTRSARRSRT